MRALLAFLLAFAVAGCGEAHDHDDHDHDQGAHDHATDQHEAKHGGVLVELGDHAANVELVLDAETGTLTAYLFGPHAEEPARSAADAVDVSVQVDGKEIALKLMPQANRLSGETVGNTSTFRAQHDALKGGKIHGGRVGPLKLRGVDFEATDFTWPAD